MRSFGELRDQAWKTTRQGGWLFKLLVVQTAFLALLLPVQVGWQHAVSSMGIQTWDMFFQAKVKALLSGLDLTVPSRAIAISMTEATAFEMFFNCVIQGIFLVGLASLFLHAARGDRARWFARAFVGLRVPLGVAMLLLRIVLQVVLWGMLFIVPGIVAFYRYRQAWNLKADHPDWSAGRCLSESARLMSGNKWRCFCFECSYWRPITLLLLGLFALALLSVVSVPGTVGNILSFALSIGCMWGGFALAAYLSIGQALFYLELKAADPAPVTAQPE